MKFIRVIKSGKNNILRELQSLLPQYDISQTDNWIYVGKDNCNLILAIDIDDTLPKYEILDEENMPIAEGQYDIESKAYSKNWIKELSNLIDTEMQDLEIMYENDLSN